MAADPAPAPAAPPPVEPAMAQAGMQQLVALAMQHSPRLSAIRQQLTRSQGEALELEGFFDPQLTASGGRKSDLDTGVDSLFTLGGVETAVMPGAYLSSGVEETFLHSVPGSPEGVIGQTRLTAGVRVPLWRDRGFKLWKLDTRRVDARREAALARVRNAGQEVRRDAELGYVTWLEARTQAWIAASATRRVEELMAQTQELIRLQTVPDYQLLPARMEVNLRRDEEASTRQSVETTRQRLAEILGQPASWEPPAAWSPDLLVSWVAKDAPPAAFPGEAGLQERLAQRGAWQEYQYLIAAAQTELAKTREQARSDVSLEVKGVWAGEDGAGGVGGGRYTIDRNTGGLVALTWSRPWGFSAERGRSLQASATIAELQENLRALETGIRTDLQVTFGEWRQGYQRLALLGEAVAAARQTLSAEEERFRLGQGRSRNVLDAQKDLNDSTRRQVALAAEVLRTGIRYRFAAGYPESAGPQAKETAP